MNGEIRGRVLAPTEFTAVLSGGEDTPAGQNDSNRR